MTIIMFELSFPSRNSWNGRWSGDEKKHTVRRKLSPAKKEELVGRHFFHNFGDGWSACVSVREPNFREKPTNNFQGYNWMINSIINTGKILTEKESTNDTQTNG